MMLFLFLLSGHALSVSGFAGIAIKSSLALGSLPQTQKTASMLSLSLTPPPDISLYLRDGGDRLVGSLTSLAVAEDGGSIIDTLRTIAIGLTAIIFLLAGLTYVVAAVIVPAAAKEVEKECKELAPELWDEYMAKLEPGQTLDQRPELLQELGEKLQPLIKAKLAAMETAIDNDTEYVPPPSYVSSSAPSTIDDDTPKQAEPVILDVSSMAGNQWKDDDTSRAKKAVDAEVVSEDKENPSKNKD